MISIPELTDLDIAFGGCDHIPAWDDIPKEFRDMNATTKWHKCQAKRKGLTKPKPFGPYRLFRHRSHQATNTRLPP